MPKSKKGGTKKQWKKLQIQTFSLPRSSEQFGSEDFLEGWTSMIVRRIFCGLLPYSESIIPLVLPFVGDCILGDGHWDNIREDSINDLNIEEDYQVPVNRMCRKKRIPQPDFRLDENQPDRVDTYPSWWNDDEEFERRYYDFLND